MQAYVLRGVRLRAFYLLRVPRVQDTLLVLLAFVPVDRLDYCATIVVRVFNAILCVLLNDIIPAIIVFRVFAMIQPIRVRVRELNSVSVVSGHTQHFPTSWRIVIEIRTLKRLMPS